MRVNDHGRSTAHATGLAMARLSRATRAASGDNETDVDTLTRRLERVA
jgi:hypothetical protein